MARSGRWSIVSELTGAGHRVLGMTRLQQGADALGAAGAEPHHGTLEDLESLKRGAAQADGVVHTAFDQYFSRFAENAKRIGA